MKLFVSEPKFQSLEHSMSCHTIAKNGMAKLEVIKGKEYVITGGCGDGKGGWEAFFANKIMPLSKYRGKLKPLEYVEHHNEVDEGKRKRGYKGMLITINKAPYVITGESIDIFSNKNETQLKLL